MRGLVLEQFPCRTDTRARLVTSEERLRHGLVAKSHEMPSTTHTAFAITRASHEPPTSVTPFIWRRTFHTVRSATLPPERSKPVTSRTSAITCRGDASR